MSPIERWLEENMKKLTIALPLMLFVVSAAPRAESGLEADAFIVADKPNESTLVLRITNRGETPQTILTEKYSRNSMSMNGRRLPQIGLSYEILTIGSAEQPEQWIFIPSLPKLAPVTLRKGESAQVIVPLDDTTVKAMKEAEGPATIRYSIGKRISERFGLWQGTLEIRESYKSMTSK